MRTVVIRMGRVPFMDTIGLTALDEIVADFQRIGVHGSPALTLWLNYLCVIGAGFVRKKKNSLWQKRGQDL